LICPSVGEAVGYGVSPGVGCFLTQIIVQLPAAPGISKQLDQWIITIATNTFTCVLLITGTTFTNTTFT